MPGGWVSVVCGGRECWMRGSGGQRRPQWLTRGQRGSGARRRLVLPLLAVVLLIQAACGQQSIAALDRLSLGAAQLGGAQLAALERQAQADMAASRQRLLLQRAADWYLARLSLDDQLGQMIINEMDGQTYSPDMAIMVAQQHIGGMIVFGDNYGTFDQTKLLFSTIQRNAPIPLFIATDQEGGGITRVGQYFGYFPSPRTLGDSGDLKMAYDWGRTTALDLQQLGINTNFAPVVDVSVNGGEPWSSSRTFSEDPKTVAIFAQASMDGQRSVGEISALKHFPGLGRVPNDQDPHVILPIVNVSVDQLWRSEEH